MNPSHCVLLEFDTKKNRVGENKKLTDGLSVVAQIGDTLWVANDETVNLERLTLAEAGQSGNDGHAKGHARFSLDGYLRLPKPPVAKVEEADLEGLAYDDGYLWLVGSHSLKRKRPKAGDDPENVLSRLAKVEGEGNRYLLARIPVEENDGTFVLAKEAKGNEKKRTAAQLHGGKMGNDLIDALREDDHLKKFIAIPGKDNGFDIEGLAVKGGRLFLGLRGPVLRGWALILEVVPKEDKKDPTTLTLTSIGPKGRSYRKHFLQLGGLGVRDLCVRGNDLLILAGPTMDLDGPVAVFRWLNGANPEGEAVVFANNLERLFDVPYGQGVDHAEGMALLAPANGASPDSVLVVYDSAAASRQRGENILAADVFRLP